MHKILKPNIDISNKFAYEFNEYIKANHCYDNIANIVLNFPEIEMQYPAIQVSYGGIQIFPLEEDKSNLYSKHIFFIYEGKAIEPTLAKHGKLKEETKLLPIVTFTIEEYLELLGNELETSPLSVLKEIDKKSKELAKDDILLIG